MTGVQTCALPISKFKMQKPLLVLPTAQGTHLSAVDLTPAPFLLPLGLHLLSALLGTRGYHHVLARGSV